VPNETPSTPIPLGADSRERKRAEEAAKKAHKEAEEAAKKARKDAEEAAKKAHKEAEEAAKKTGKEPITKSEQQTVFGADGETQPPMFFKKVVVSRSGESMIVSPHGE